MSHKIFLGLGSNLGERRANLRQAVHALEARGIVRVSAISPVYETEPWGVAEQPEFLNICLAGSTDLTPSQLLQQLKQIEADMGREPGEKWGPRLIDLDILFYDDLIEHEATLTIPHPRLPERAFVLVPLAAIAPQYLHPQAEKTVSALLDALPASERGSVHRLPLPLEWGRRTYVMGILNVTPDSFSGDGILQDEAAWIDAAVRQARRFVDVGADLLDIGGESTRPGSTPVTADEEKARVLPVLRAVRQALPDALISVDTYRADVAKAALDDGADWINDIWGLRMDPEMAPVVAAAGCPLVIMHNRSRPKNVEQETRLGGRYVGIEYDDLLDDVRRELQDSVDLALEQGIKREQIILDPGIGFGKTVSQNVQLIDQLDQLQSLGFPLLVGTSRKSFIGYTLDLPPDERMEGTAATVAIAIDRGADIVRVHDVPEMVRVARMTDRIVRRRS